jgi:raffinose/stachyose/melibiose transport system substrate-binding protein
MFDPAGALRDAPAFPKGRLMNTPTYFSRRSILGLAGLGAGAIILGGCSDDDDGGSGGTAQVDWWHIANTEPMLPIWDAMAKEYQAANAGVTIKITPLENEAYKARLTTVTQAGTPPDIFHTWGGGVLKQQIDAGLVKDLTADIADVKSTFTGVAMGPYEFDGKAYALPVDQGMIGFWYNKALFSSAGVSAPPTTWGELLDAVRKLKAANVTPIALAGKDKWPGHYYWAYLSMRIGGLDLLSQAGEDGNFNKPEFVAAGERLKELVDLAPFQKGFLGAEYGAADGQAALMGNGKAAMELMGQWAPSTQKEASGKPQGIGEDLGFFPFPAVDGGKGTASDAFGGGGGFAIGKDAPDEAVDFLKFLVSIDNQRKAAATGAIIPIVKGAEDGLKDPNAKIVAETLGASTGFQLYLDQAYAPEVGQEVNEAVAQLMAGKMAPDKVTKTITETAQR